MAFIKDMEKDKKSPCIHGKLLNIGKVTNLMIK